MTRSRMLDIRVSLIILKCDAIFGMFQVGKLFLYACKMPANEQHITKLLPKRVFLQNVIPITSPRRKHQYRCNKLVAFTLPCRIAARARGED